MQGNQEQTKTLTPSSPSSVLIDVWKKASQWRQRSFSAQSNLPPLLSKPRWGTMIVHCMRSSLSHKGQKYGWFKRFNRCWWPYPRVAFVCGSIILQGDKIKRRVNCLFSTLLYVYRAVKSILKNAPKRREQEEQEDMMELDPLEPEDEGLIYSIVSVVWLNKGNYWRP